MARETTKRKGRRRGRRRSRKAFVQEVTWDRAPGRGTRRLRRVDSDMVKVFVAPRVGRSRFPIQKYIMYMCSREERLQRIMTRYPCERWTRNVEGTTCVICLAQFERGDVTRTLRCSHVFHENCIQEWLHRSHSYSCPTCRACLVRRPLLH